VFKKLNTMCLMLDSLLKICVQVVVVVHGEN